MGTQPSPDSPSRDANQNNPLNPENREAASAPFLDLESRATVVWNCFDPDTEFEVVERDRPHWDQPGAVTFVTMRLADSMPKAVVQRWLKEQDEWLRRHGIDAESRSSSPDSPSRDAILAQAPQPIRRAFLKFKNQRWHENLDHCHGRCLLRRPEFATLVADSLRTFDGQRYDLERCVIMPNHVHLLVQMRSGWSLRKQCESWMRYTGRQINALNRSSGAVWAEPFDHIVRNERQFDSLRKYIAENPAKAGLPAGESLLWIRASHDSPSREAEGPLNPGPRDLASTSLLDSESRATIAPPPGQSSHDSPSRDADQGAGAS